jgi:outer membrane protein TolC
MWNDYDGGLSTPQNRDGWSVGLGVNIPIFDGFLTREKVAEAKAKIGQLQQRRFLLAEGIGMQLRGMYIAMDASEKVVQASGSAADSSRDDTDLTLRAYQSGLVATEKVIRAQLQQALVTAEHDRAVYDHMVLQTQIDLAVGEHIQTERNADH